MRRLLALLSLVAGSGCFDLSLPGVPAAPGSGVVQGTIVHAEPGQTALRPATGATVELVGSGVRVQATGDTAVFNLTPVDTAGGSVFIRFDGDGDGQPEKQRLLRLEGLGAGRGKTVSLGQVVIGSNGAIRGKVLRGNVSGPTNHGGTSIFVPEGPFFTFTGDDGSFLLENLPEGRLTVAMFRAGYRAAAETVDLRPGEVFPLRTITLPVDPTSMQASVRGRVLLPEGTGAPDVTVTLSSGRTATTDAEGRYAFADLPYGVYSVGFVKSGFLTGELLNIIVASPTVTLRDVTLAPGTSTSPQLDAGRPAYDGGATGGGAAGGSTAGGSAAGGSAAGGSAAGGSAAGGSAAGGSTAGGSAAGGSAAGGSAGGSAAGGSAAGGSAAGGSAAGGSAAGGSAAGGSAAGGSSAGGSPAGGSPAGGSPAGGSPAGGSAAGGSAAGGSAGPVPVAIIDAPLVVAPNAFFTISGQRSTGDRPFLFNWSQDAGPTITIPNNGTQLAASPMLRAPASATLLKFNLAVTEPSGRVSQPASVLIPVAVPPVAIIDAGFPALVYASQRVILNGAGSTDQNGSGIASWDWTVAPSLVTATPLDGGLLQLDMPATVGTPVVVTAQLSVVNGLLVRSSTVSASFQLTNAAAPSWSLDAGPSQTVGSGSVVTLSALASSPIPGANFVYDWSPSSETTDGGAPDWLLTNPNSASTTFVAPKVEGPTPRLITLTARATETTGVLTPSQRTASIVISVIDRRRPQVVTTSASSGVQGTASGFVLFDEDINPATLSGITLTPAPGSPTSSLVQMVAAGPRVTFQLRPPATPGFMYTLNVAGVDDLAPSPQNQMVAIAPIQFFPQVRWSPVWESASSSSTEPWPGIAVRRATPSAPLQVFVFGRKDGVSWFGAPFEVFSCTTPPCAIADDSSAPASPLAGPFVRSRRGHVVGGAPIAALQASDFVGDAGVAWRFSQGAWSPLPPYRGALFTVSPATTLSSTYVDDAGIKIDHLDGGAWVPFSTVSTNTSLFWVGPTADPLLTVSAPSSSGYFIAGRSSSTGQSYIFSSGSGASFAADGPLNGVELRPANLSGGSGLNFVRFGNGNVAATCWGAGTCGLNTYLTGVNSFDTYGNGSGAAYIAAASAGQLELYHLTGGQSVPQRIAGPLRGGMPSTMLNNDPACYADRPELFIVEGIVFVTWQERCAPGPWRVYVRALE